ncbi:MAG: aldolase/citrate lyase family protein [Burkholderiales bacterium]
MSNADISFCRSFLFTPGNRPERFAKGAASGADALILDLEDAVAAQDKDHARATVIKHFSGDWRAALATGQLCGLRVNNLHTMAGVKDLEALIASRAVPDFIVIPKVESAPEVDVFVRQLTGPQATIQFLCAIESARGLEAAMAIAAVSPRVRSLGFGGADLAVEFRAELSWEPMFMARARLVQAAAAAGIGLVDVPHVDLSDDAGLQRDAVRVKAMGFTGKLAIHPKQVKPIQDVFTPTQEEAARAAGIVAAFERSAGNVVEYQGRMVEGPIVKVQERILALARRAGVPVSAVGQTAPQRPVVVADKAGPFSAYCIAGDKRYIERFGLDFEDFAAGQRFRHRPGVTITQQDNLDEALDTLNSAMIHYDAHYSAQTTWKKPLMVSTVTLQRVIGMASKTFAKRRAIRGMQEIAMTAPVFGGDTLYAESEILGVEASNDEDCGYLNVVSRGVNAEGRVVARITYTVEIFRRGKHPDDRGRNEQRASDPRFAHHRQVPDGTLIEQFGFFFEDCAPGETFVHYSRRTFHRDEAIEHAYRSLDVAPQYHDERWIREHQDGRYRVAETWLISAATALSTRTFGRVVANLGWYDIALQSPVFAGDTVHAESTILEKRESKSRPNEGILNVETRAYNQHGQLVVSYKRNLLVYKRNAQTPYPKAGY